MANVVLINPFEVPPAGDDRFLTGWHALARPPRRRVDRTVQAAARGFARIA